MYRNFTSDSSIGMQGPVAKYMSRAQGSPVLKGTSGQRADVQALGQAHINAVAGACLAIGIKFAGSGNADAEQVLRHYVLYFLKAKLQDSDAGQGLTQEQRCTLAIMFLMFLAHCCTISSNCDAKGQGIANVTITARLHCCARPCLWQQPPDISLQKMSNMTFRSALL